MMRYPRATDESCFLQQKVSLRPIERIGHLQSIVFDSTTMNRMKNMYFGLLETPVGFTYGSILPIDLDSSYSKRIQ